MDDILDILGISIFASGGKWCTLNNTPCIPLASCEMYITDGKCEYASGDNDEDNNEKT